VQDQLIKMREKEENQCYEVHSEGVQDAGILALRLQTERLVNRFRIYLTGKIIETKYDDESGEPKSMEITIAKPKANPQGVHFLLNFFEGIVNPQTVQGNLVDSEMYEDMIEEIHLGLNQDIINNMYMWDINEDEADPLINNMITTIRLFLTRTIGNKERESYNQTIRHQESSSISNQKGFSLLTRGGV